MKRSKSEILQGFEFVRNYFKRFEDHPFYGPASEATAKIVSIIEEEELTIENLQKMVNVFNQVADQFASSSGWYDLKIRIVALLEECGIDTFNDGDKIRIKEN